MAISSLKKRLALGCAAVGLMVATPALAQPRTFNVPAQDARQAIPQFGRQAGVQISAPTGRLRGVRTQAISGNLDVRAALRAMLEGTGLEIASDTGSMIVLRMAVPGSGEAQAGGAAADNAGADEQAIVVTGTHIRGIDPGASPLEVYDEADFERAGFPTIDRFLTTIPQNVGSETAQASSNGLIGLPDQGYTSAPNLRGLGADSTLTLLNGRRLTPASGPSAAFADVSAVPVAAISRIEVMPDGASAIYGADAVGGVVNIVMNRNFSGFETRARYANDTNGTTDEVRLSQTAGTNWSSGGIVVSYQYYSANELQVSERSYTRSLDLRDRGGRDFRPAGSGQPGTVFAVDGSLNALGGAPFGAIPAGQDGTALQVATVVPNQRTSADLRSFTIIPRQSSHSVFASLQQELTNDLTFSAFVILSDRETRTKPSFLITNAVVPASHPLNPFGEAVRVGYNYTNELDRAGIWDATAKQRSFFVSASLEGRFPLAGLSSWHWNAGVSHGRDRLNLTNVTINNAVQTAVLASDVNRATTLNLFGDGSAQNLDTFRSILSFVSQRRTSTSTTVDAVIDGELFSLPGGPVRTAFGFEYRHEDFGDITRLLAIGGSSTRNVASAFGEIRIPIVGDGNRVGPLHGLEISLASRLEDYSVFGETVNNRVGIVARLGDQITLRGSWGTSFRTPLLTELFLQQRRTPAVITDPLLGAPATRLVIGSGGNPDLETEEATVWSLGADFRPRWLSNTLIRLTYFNIDFDRRITAFGAVQALANETRLPPGVIVRDPVTRELLELNLYPFNAAVTRLRGLDFSASWESDVRGVGTLMAGLSGSYMFAFDSQLSPLFPVIDDLNTVFSPVDLRAQGYLGFRRGGLSAQVSINYTADYLQDVFALTNGTFLTIPAQATVDLNLTYRHGSASRGWTLSAGATNLFDDRPPFANLGGFAYDAQTGDARGRVIYLQLATRF